MDSIKLSERSRAHLNIRNSATNTEPVRCGFCGSGTYIPRYTQANSIRTSCPGSPKCKSAIDKCNDNFSFHQPLFSSPPLLQPIFSNIFVPSNIGPPHGSAIPSTQLLEHDSTRRRPNSTLNYMFYHNNSTDAKLKGVDYSKMQENVPVIEHEKEHCRSCSFPSSCECMNPFPWTCPFIVPLLSYYVIWNSQFSNGKLSAHPFLQCDLDKSKTTCSDEATIRKMNTITSKKKDEEKDGGFWSESEKVGRNGHDIADGSLTSFVSATSLDSGEKTFLNTRNKNNSHKSVKNKMDNLPVDNGSTDKINLEKNYQRQKGPDDKTSTKSQRAENFCMNYNDKPCMPSSIFISLSDEHSNYNERYELATSDFNKLYVEKIQNEESESPKLDIRIDTVDTMFEKEYSSSQKVQEKNQVKQKSRDRPSKKCIKNFTMANEIQYQKFEEKNIVSMAAGGDLSRNCDGYRVSVSHLKMSQGGICPSDEKDEENTISGDNVEEVSDKEKISSPREEEEIKKISRSNTRSWSSSKSRIAKLAPNYKSKDVGTLTIQTSGKQQQQQLQTQEQHLHGEGTFTKKKHNCLVIENTTENGTDFKINKSENCESVQNQNGGSNKKNSKNKSKNRSNKKEGKKSKSENPSQNSRSEDDSLPSTPHI